jgi:hypothetical protein
VARVAPGGVEPRGGAAPRNLVVVPPDPRDALMFASTPRRERRMQEFDVVVRMSDTVPGMWPTSAVTSRSYRLDEAGYRWEDLTEDIKEEVVVELWTRFNAMFPAATAADAAAWAAERWYEPYVDELFDVGSRARGVLFGCESEGGCMFAFRFPLEDACVHVSYRGPVHFNLALARAARHELYGYTPMLVEDQVETEEEWLTHNHEWRAREFFGGIRSARAPLFDFWDYDGYDSDREAGARREAEPEEMDGHWEEPNAQWPQDGWDTINRAPFRRGWMDHLEGFEEEEMDGQSPDSPPW